MRLHRHSVATGLRRAFAMALVGFAALLGGAPPIRRPPFAPAAADRTGFGDVYAELYINEPSDANCVALFRRGTQVVEDLVQIDDFARPP